MKLNETLSGISSIALGIDQKIKDRQTDRHINFYKFLLQLKFRHKYLPNSFISNGLLTLHWNGTGTCTENRTGTIGINGSCSLFLSQTNVNISTWCYRSTFHFGPCTSLDSIPVHCECTIKRCFSIVIFTLSQGRVIYNEF